MKNMIDQSLGAVHTHTHTHTHTDNSNSINTKEKNTFEHYAQIPSGTTINVNKGDYIIAISVNPITATNSETIVENFLCTRANGVGVVSQVFKATDTTMTLTVVDGWSFAYYVIKR